VINLDVFEVINKTLWSRRLRAAIRNLFYALTLEYAVIKLKEKANSCKSVENCVDLAFNIFTTFPFEPWRIRPEQVKDEIMGLMEILMRYRPKFILEIGTARGGSFFLFTRAAASDATLVSIDLPGGSLGGGCSELKIPYYESFALLGQKIYLPRMDSHKEITLHAINRILDGHKLDFLFIDGDHTYQGVKKDFEMYGELVDKGGIIAFHDICHHPQNNVEVEKVWHEIKDRYEHIEIVRNWKQGWAGIGVLYV
jgi:cephalosporin hydroxylase